MIEALNSADSLHSINNNDCSSASSAALFPSRQRQSVPSLALWARAGLLPYVAVVSTVCFPTVGQTLGFNALSAKGECNTTGLCEFWHSGCLPGSVPLCFWVCSRRPSGFGDVSCWFSVILCHVISVKFPHKADVLSNRTR